MSKHQELFQRYRSDRTPAAFEALVRACRPLVASVCWRYLRRPEDVDDAIQETFLKLATHADTVHGDVGSWLTATAYAASVDLIRRASRERRRRIEKGHIIRSTVDLPGYEHRLVQEALHARLADALLVLDDASRELIVERFFRKTPLRVIAGRYGQSVATISRHTAAAVRDLTAVLRDMGIPSLDELTLAEHFGDPAHLTDLLQLHMPDELRFAADWRTPLYAPAGSQSLAPVGPLWPGWSRRIRVGVLTSYLSSITRGTSGQGVWHDVEVQVRTTEFLSDPAFQLIGVAEPGTTHRGSVERVLREYELTGGLLDATDAEGLRTLDVILIGTVFAIDPAVAAAVAQAVRSGAGLLNEWWSGGVTIQSDANVRSLMLADSNVRPYHMEPNCTHGIHITGTVRESHVLLPGLRAGDQVPVAACGPIYRILPDARVLIEKDVLVMPQQHGVPDLGPTRAPAYVVGQLGRGRVVAAMIRMFHGLFAASLAVDANRYITNLFAWLAEPRRE